MDRQWACLAQNVVSVTFLLSIKHATFRLTDHRLYDNLSSLLFNVNADDSAVKWLV